MSSEHQLLFAVLAFEDELIDLKQLTSACSAWASDKSRPLADLLVDRGWVSVEDRAFIDKKVERKVAKHHNDPRVTLNVVTRGDVSDALRSAVDDSDIRESLSSWPDGAPVLIESIGATLDESDLPKTRYTWISEVGTGGLGKVWLARDNELSREVALKEVKPGSASGEAVRRLIKEAQITGQLQHPGIVPVYEVSSGNRPFYTMKLVRGGTLSQAIWDHHENAATGKADPLAERQLLSVFLSVCEAVGYAHSRGVIHRDLKPDNIVVGDFGEAIVLDWGLARQVSNSDEDSAPVVVTEDGQTGATQPGKKLGTPAYMSPEQASGRVDCMDERTDIYGLGAILFEVLTGQAPHRTQKVRTPESSNDSSNADVSTSPVATLLQRIATGPTPRARAVKPAVPQELDEICAKAMARQRSDRFQTAKELKAALLEFQIHEESIELAGRADADLNQARSSRNYDAFARARFGFETALELWSENNRAAAGLKEACESYARTAFERGDFDLAFTVLEGIAEQTEFVAKVQSAMQERDSRTHRIRRLRRFGIASSLTVALTASVAAISINSERTRALKNEGLAKAAEADARREAENAERSLMLAEQTSYISDMLMLQHFRENEEAIRMPELLKKYRERDDLKGFEWGYWSRILENNVLTLEGHADSVTDVAFSPNGRSLASSCWDGTVKIWNVATGEESLSLKASTNKVGGIVFSPDGRQLLTSNGDEGTVQVWDVETGAELFSLTTNTEKAYDVAFSPDGNRLAAGTSGGVIKVWDWPSRRELLSLRGHTSLVLGVTFSPDGLQLGSASPDGTCRLWDAVTGDELQTFRDILSEDSWFEDVSFSPDGERIVSVNQLNPEGMIHAWDANGLGDPFLTRGPAGYCSDVAVSPHGTHVAAGSSKGTVMLSDWSTIQPSKPHFILAHETAVSCVAFSPDQRRLASASLGGKVKLWPVGGQPDSSLLSGHRGSIDCIAFSSDGNRLLSASFDGTMKVWDTASEQTLVTHEAEISPGRFSAFSADGLQLAAGRADGTIGLYETSSGELRTMKHESGITCVAFSPDGRRLASTSEDGAVCVWYTATQRLSLALKGHDVEAEAVAFSADGTQLASGDENGTIKVWDSATGHEILELSHTDWVNWVSFSPVGQQLAALAEDNSLVVWNLATGTETFTLKLQHTTMKVAFSPDGKRLATGDWDGEVKVWDASSGQELLKLQSEVKRIGHLTFSDDGRRLAVAGDEGIQVWDARPWTPKQRTEAAARRLLLAHHDPFSDSIEEFEARIRSDLTVTREVRQQALDWTGLFLRNRHE